MVYMGIEFSLEKLSDDKAVIRHGRGGCFGQAIAEGALHVENLMAAVAVLDVGARDRLLKLQFEILKSGAVTPEAAAGVSNPCAMKSPAPVGDACAELAEQSHKPAKIYNPIEVMIYGRCGGMPGTVEVCVYPKNKSPGWIYRLSHMQIVRLAETLNAAMVAMAEKTTLPEAEL